MKKFLFVFIFFLVVTTNLAWAAKKQNTAPGKEITVKTSVDVGDNAIKLLEKIAEQIGTTADKVFPWYVKQSILSGYLYLIAVGIAFLTGILLMFRFYGKAEWDNGNRYTVLSVIGIVVSIFAFLFGIFGLSGSISQIYNPEYHALHNLVSEMSKLVQVSK